MPANAIYLLRHGDSRTDDVKRYIGRTDNPLNVTGRAQAEFWRKELQDITFQGIFCSTLRRSQETASIIAEGRETAVQALIPLQEINMGSWENLPLDELRRNAPEEYERRGANLAEHRPPGGESFHDLASRVLPLFRELGSTTTGNLLIVGHAGVNRVILCHLLNLPTKNLFQIRQEYGCLNIIHRTETGLLPYLINIFALYD